jgi:hypothetical protein
VKVRLSLLSVAALALLATTAGAAPPPKADPAATAKAVDKLLARENAGAKTREAPAVDDRAFLRRVSVDLNGRIPTDAEIGKFMSWPAAERRARAVEDFMGRDQYADRWAIFYSDLFRVRYGSDGGAALQAFVHEAVRTNVPYDVLTRKLLGASGRAGSQPETGFILGDDADPYALAGVVSQVFMGVRISCAQCHNHPFDVWTQEDFYDLAAFFGRTQRIEHRVKMQILGIFLNERTESIIMWPPETKAAGKPRKAVPAKFPFEMDKGDGPAKHLARLKALRDWQEADAKARAAAKGTNVDDLIDGGGTAAKKDDLAGVSDEVKAAMKKLDLEGDLYRASELRRKLAEAVTDPRNRFYSRAFVNRVWAELVGRGFVNPIDDFRNDNPASHPKTLDYLAEEFVASGYDFRFLVATIVRTEAYQRGHLPGNLPAPERLAAEKAFTATPVRRMGSEALFDSIVQAGHLFTPKHRPGENVTTVVTYQQVAVAVKDDPKNPGGVKPPRLGGDKPAMPAMPAMGGAKTTGAYDLERGIEVDFKDALKKKDVLQLDKMTAKSPEELEAEMMMRSGTMPAGTRVRYVTKEVKTLVDDNPRFTSSMRMASPAPVGHFLRVFGQTDRAALDERRDHSPSMRQALMMLNGKLTNEAARVGPLEPVANLVTGPKADVDAAIKLVYREALTREPTADELADAKAIIKEAATPAEGLADLRWALFNSNEFRFIP